MAQLSTLWPGWETVGMIGKGGFGSVFEIQRSLFDNTEKAALKLITIPQSKGEIDELYGEGYDHASISGIYQQHLKNILSEYTIMRKMSGCINVVACDDMHYVQHSDGIGWDIYIKMELLTPIMKAFPGEISEQLVIKLGKDICNALQTCKLHGVIHRDIKPQNIFISAAGEFKLGDFGIAKAIEKTTGGTKIGTYKYMAPEVYNNQPYGAGADIYSLGLVLYWLLNDRRMPFLPLPPEIPSYSEEEQAKLRRFRGEQLPPPKHGSPELQAVVLKACAFRQEDRFVDAADMRAALEALEPTEFIHPVEPVRQPAHEPEQDGDATVRVRHKEQQIHGDLHPQYKPYIKPSVFDDTDDNRPKAGSYARQYSQAGNRQKESGGMSTKMLVIIILCGLLVLTMTMIGIMIGTMGSDSETEQEPSAQTGPVPETTEPKTQVIDPNQFRVGNIVRLGTYEQDNNGGNGEEAIEWKVLAVEDGKALVVSRYALDCLPYHNTNEAVTWEDSSLRRWMNADFYQSAFTDEERTVILNSTISAEQPSGYTTGVGNDTQDYVFLLSISDVNRYFASKEKRLCGPTYYAEAQGVWANSTNGNCWWWLRDSTSNQKDAYCVYSVGTLDKNGVGVHDTNGGVRPAMWIDLTEGE